MRLMAMAMAQAEMTSVRPLTWIPMMSRRPVSMTSGTSASGMPKESTTWLSTSTLVGLIPMASTASAGIIVIARRSARGIWNLMKPAITIWPA